MVRQKIEMIFKDCKECGISMHMEITQTLDTCTTCQNEGVAAGKKDARELRKLVKKSREE